MLRNRALMTLQQVKPERPSTPVSDWPGRHCTHKGFSGTVLKQRFVENDCSTTTLRRMTMRQPDEHDLPAHRTKQAPQEQATPTCRTES